MKKNSSYPNTPNDNQLGSIDNQNKSQAQQPNKTPDGPAFALKNPGSFDKPGQDQLYSNDSAAGAKTAPTGNALKDPKDWTTGDEPMTGAQRSYLHTLAGEAGEQIPDELTKAEASEKIEELQHKTGRGLPEQEKEKE